jgi:NADP-dependent aldehyde dehydrogenase
VARGPEIAADLATSVLLGGGQFCTKPGLILLPSTPDGWRVCDDLADRFARAAPAYMLTQQVLHGFEKGCAALQLDAGTAVLATGREAVGAATPVLFGAAADQLPNATLDECFGPTAVVADYNDDDALLAAATRLPGALTATVHAEPDDHVLLARLVPALATKVGRLVFNEYPTGVAVSPAMHHGGPYPASTAPGYTSVGVAAIDRFLRPVTYQNAPMSVLPPELRA